nr:hypothetical protein [Tanacetum cinerariifolium]GEV89633.1 hypothetical protein [Tanacetum cinerariifolium]GEW06049.1 hypothetical protein [Tanacetum cinerariifolium]
MPQQEDDLEELLKRLIRKVFTKFHVTARLSLHHWKSNRAKMYYWKCLSKTRLDLDEVFSNRKIIDIVRVRHHEVYGHEQIDEVCVKRNDDKFYTFAESDFKYLNKNDIEDMYYICLRRRNDTHEYKQPTTLIRALIIFIRSCVIWERVHDFQLGIASYQIKIYLTAPTITYPGIVKYHLYSIIGVPFVGIVYENNKKEKIAMDIDELQKFSDATLRRVLRKISVINMEANHEVVKISLSAKDKELMALLKEEIEETLKYHHQMRR